MTKIKQSVAVSRFSIDTLACLYYLCIININNTQNIIYQSAWLMNYILTFWRLTVCFTIILIINELFLLVLVAGLFLEIWMVVDLLAFCLFYFFYYFSYVFMSSSIFGRWMNNIFNAMSDYYFIVFRYCIEWIKVYVFNVSHTHTCIHNQNY